MTLIGADDLKDWLGFPSISESQDDAMTACIAAAAGALEKYWGRELVEADDEVVTARVFGTYGYTVRTDDFVGTPTLEESSDRTTWTAVTDPFWCGPDDNDAAGTLYQVHLTDKAFERWVRVTAAYGLGAGLVADARQALLLKAARLWSRKKSPTMVEGTSDWGIVRVTSREDPDIVSLLGATRRLDRLAGLA